MRGKTIVVNCDNTAAVSWLLKMRGSNKVPVAESLDSEAVRYLLHVDGHNYYLQTFEGCIKHSR